MNSRIAAADGLAGAGTPPLDPGLPPVLELHGVRKTFRQGKRTVEALAGVSLRSTPGIVTGLIGPDGAGKTTLMRLAAGLLLPEAGSIRVLGLDTVRETAAVHEAIGYMPQRFGLYEDLSVWENLELYADLQGVSRAERTSRYEELLEMTGLGPFTRRLAGQLSGGMKQKLGLACTLIHPPRLLLLDEPTVGVDPISRRELWEIVYRLVRQEGMSVLLSTAYLDEAERCGEVILIHEGRVLGQRPPQAFSGELEGRCFLASGTSLRPRDLQERFSEHTGVVDAIVQSDGVRVVLAPGQRPDGAALASGAPGLALAPVSARFEDSFVAMLHGAAGAASRTAAAPVREGGTLPPADGPAVEVDGLQRRFGSFYAVKGVSFQVQRGEVFGLLGANGAGKSTTYRMLCGLLPSSGGRAVVAGRDLRHAAAAARARIGYMAQKFSLYGNLTVLQNLAFFARTYGLGRRERAERVRWALAEFELGALADAESAELPLGHKQRLALACALMHEPEILFLDEPTSGMDPLVRRQFWRRIGGLARRGATVMITTHFLEEAEYCDRVAIMAEGEILTLGTPAEIKASARADDLPAPTMEDAFIRLIQQHANAGPAPAGGTP